MATAALIEAPVTYSSLGFILFATISVQEPVLLVLWAIGLPSLDISWHSSRFCPSTHSFVISLWRLFYYFSLLQLLLQLLLLAFTFICVGGKLVEEYFEVLRSFNPLELFKCKVYFNRSRD